MGKIGGTSFEHSSETPVVAVMKAQNVQTFEHRLSLLASPKRLA